MITIFKPQVNVEHRYAVAIPAEGGIMCPIQSYDTLGDLQEGYKTWKKFAEEGGITRPLPIEFLGEEDKCRVLTDIIGLY